MNIRALNGLIERVKLAVRAGLQFEGKRDLYTVFGYKRNLTVLDYVGKYTRQDIAKRLINAPVRAIWRDPPVIKGSNKEFENDFDSFVRRFGLWNVLERADRMMCLGRYSGLVLGLDDTGNMQQMARKGANLLYMHPYSEASLAVKSLEKNVFSERYNLPAEYEVRAPDPQAFSAATGIDGSNYSHGTTPEFVHWTRVIHFANQELEDNIFGVPEMMSVYNVLDDMLKVTGGAAETYWLTGRGGLQLDLDKEMELSPEEAAELSDEVDEYSNQLRRVLRTRGVKANMLSAPIPDPRGTFDVLVNLLSSASGIPKRILLGAEAGQLASEQDRANWADRVRERRSSVAEPIFLTPFIRKGAEMGWYADPGEDIIFEWPEAFKMSPLENGQEAAQRARSAVNLSRQTQFGFPLVTLEEARVMVGLPPQPKEGMGQLPESIDPNEIKKEQATKSQKDENVDMPAIEEK